MYYGMYRVCIQKCIESVLCTYDTYQYGAYVLVCIVVCIGMYRARMMSWYPPIHTHTGTNTSTNTLRIHANTGTNAYEYVTTTLRAPLGAGYIACDSPYNLAPPPRGPGGTARARQCRARRARPAGPRAHGGAAPRSSDDATASSWGLSAPANASRRSNAFTVLAPRLLTKARRGSHRQPKINYQQRNNNQSHMLQSIVLRCLFRRHYR